MAEVDMHAVRNMRGYIRVALWQRWACILSAICEDILGWLFGRGGRAVRNKRGYIRVALWQRWSCILSAICKDTLRWLFGRGEHAVRYLQG